jgi:hypothetical protein
MFWAEALMTAAARSAIKTTGVVILSEGGPLWAAEVEAPLPGEMNWGATLFGKGTALAVPKIA